MGFRHTSESNGGECGICRAGERSGALAENVNVAMRTPEYGIGVGRDAVRIAEKTDVQSAAQNPFIGAEPLEALFRGDGERLIGDGAFGWP